MADPDNDPGGLFDLAPYYVPPAPDVEPGEQLSAGRRLTIRQKNMAAAGIHPLTRGKLHPDAAPGDDDPESRRASGLRCGGCRFRHLVDGGNRSWPKCMFGWSGDVRDEPPRYSRGPATDVKAWWPGCTDFQPIPDKGSNDDNT